MLFKVTGNKEARFFTGIITEIFNFTYFINPVINLTNSIKLKALPIEYCIR